MNVVNCRVKHIRPEYKNLEEWTKYKDNVYVGRGGVVFVDGKRFPRATSQFANPYKEGKYGDRAAVIKKYERYMRERLKQDPALVSMLKKLNGKTLGCWCAPKACHADVLVKLVNEYV